MTTLQAVPVYEFKIPFTNYVVCLDKLVMPPVTKPGLLITGFQKYDNVPL